MAHPNALRWNGTPGHYEVHYLTLTDGRTGVGAWIRYSMLAPVQPSEQRASCALWMILVDPRERPANRIGRIDGRELRSISPVRVLANYSVFALTGWRLEAVGSERKLVVEVDASRDQLAGVTYHDPDGDAAYCYNSETASMRINVYERARRVGGWRHVDTLIAPGRAHFEYAQRRPVPDVELLVW